MLDRFLEALTGRRLGGALFVLAGLLVAGAVVFGRGDAEKAPAQPKTESVRLVSIPELGLTFAHPSAWKRTVSGRVITLRSPDSSTLLTFSSPLPGRQRPAVHSALEQALRKRFAPAKLVRQAPGKLGQHPVTTFELRGFGPNKQALRVLGLVGETAYRTYAVTVITPARPSARRLVEVRAIFDTVRFTVPQTRKRG
jgi:hypothetical protein